jgi:hypothetical protein
MRESEERARMLALEGVARVCWEANRALQVRDGEIFPDEPWDAAPEWRRNAVMSIVDGIFRGNIKDAEQAHNHWWTWMATRQWECGDMKDPELRVHPSLRPWKDLTPRQQLAQRLNIHICQEVLETGVM